MSGMGSNTDIRIRDAPSFLFTLEITGFQELCDRNWGRELYIHIFSHKELETLAFISAGEV